MHGFLNFFKSNVLATALVIAAAGVTLIGTSGCYLPDLLNFSPRSAQAQGGTFSQTEAFKANAKLSDDAQRAAFVADVVGDLTPLGAPAAAAIGRALDTFGKTLAVNMEALDERSKTQAISQSDILQSQLGALLVGGAAVFGLKRRLPGAPAAG